MAAKTLRCPDCGKRMSLRRSDYGPFYGCDGFPDCDNTHGCHSDGSPLGVPADKRTRLWRIKAHAALDGLYREANVQRSSVYVWLQGQLKLTQDECHIARFNSEQCKLVIRACEATTSKELRNWFESYITTIRARIQKSAARVAARMTRNV